MTPNLKESIPMATQNKSGGKNQQQSDDRQRQTPSQQNKQGNTGSGGSGGSKGGNKGRA